MCALNSLERPFHINFEITNRCNHGCYFCSAELRKYCRKDLPTRDIIRIISKIANEDVYSVFLTGGEPLLRKDLPLIIKECLDYGINVSLSTNGVMADEKTSKLVASAGLEEIQVSIHAPNEIHDKMVGVEGAIEGALKGLKNLIEAGFSVIVAAVPTKMNHPLLPELAERVQQMGARCFRVLRLMPHSRSVLEQIVPYREMQMLVKRLSGFAHRLNNFAASIHTSAGFSTEAYDLEHWEKILHPLSHTCSAGKVTMGIMANGDCVPCLEIKNPKMICGNILHQSFSEIWDSKPMSLLRLATPDKYRGRCEECELKWTCYSARCVAYNLEGDILGDDVSCYRLIRDF